MKYLKYSIFVFIILLAGCTTLKLMMRVDPSLETNAEVYEVISPDSWAPDKKLNVSFGPYRVVNMDSGWTRTRDASDTGGFMGALVKAFGLDDDDDGGRDPDTTRTEIYQALTYEFAVHDKTTWYADCEHFAEKDVFEDKERKMHSTTVLSSQYACLYTRHTRSGSEEWVLSIDRQGSSPDPDIMMNGPGKAFVARATRGYYVTSSDGKPYKTFSPPNAGYTWKDGGKYVAAISTGEDTTRVWLGKDNPDSTNDILAMAMTGLLVYEKKIKQTLR